MPMKSLAFRGAAKGRLDRRVPARDNSRMSRSFRIRVPAACAIALGLCLPAAAFARDLPRGWAAPKAQSGCESFGPGFVKAEGTDTCVKIGGSIRVEQSYSTNDSSSFFTVPRR